MTGRAVRRFLSAMLPEHCPTVLPWFAFAHGRAPMDRIHRLALAWQAPRAKALATVLWPAASVIHAVKETRIYGHDVARHYGVPVWRQLVQQIALAHRHNIPSSSYYKFRLFEPAARAKAPSSSTTTKSSRCCRGSLT